MAFLLPSWSVSFGFVIHIRLNYFEITSSTVVRMPLLCTGLVMKITQESSRCEVLFHDFSVWTLTCFCCSFLPWTNALYGNQDSETAGTRQEKHGFPSRPKPNHSPQRDRTKPANKPKILPHWSFNSGNCDPECKVSRGSGGIRPQRFWTLSIT